MPSSRRAGRRAAWLLFAGVAAASYTLDQVSKHEAIERLSGRPDVPVVGELLQLHLTRNPGAAFSLGTEYTLVLTCLAIVATVVVLWYSRRLADKAWAVGLGLILAGIDGNLTDRMIREPGPFRGEVIDFLMLPNWPVFNVADISINVGAVLVLIQVFRGIHLDGTRIDADAGDSETDADADTDTEEGDEA